MKRTLIVLVVGGVLIALAALLDLRSPPVSAVARPTPVASVDDAVSKPVAAPMPSPPSAVPARAPEPPPVAAPAPHNPNVRDATAYNAFLEARFAADAIDASWKGAPELQAKITRALPPGSLSEPIECRQKQCRVRTSHATREQYETFLANGFQSADPQQKIWDGPVQITPPFSAPGQEPERGVISVIYLGRD